MKYQEPHVPIDHKARRTVAIIGIALIAAFWMAAFIAASWAVGNAGSRPDACAHLTAAECGEAASQ